jgi:hypothetical protein
MSISVKKKYKGAVAFGLLIMISSLFLFATRIYRNADFGSAFGDKSAIARTKLAAMQDLFETCAPLCKADASFMQAIVFPEVMRYNTLKDGIEAESLRTLYVQFGKEYADFSIGLFQMKPSFAEEVENKSAALLSKKIQKELQLQYISTDEETIRRERVERMQDKEWQLIYLTAFVAICNETYKTKNFNKPIDKLQWYATVYNAGFNRTDEYISKKTEKEHFYLQQDMPGKKFRYAAIASWYFQGG